MNMHDESLDTEEEQAWVEGARRLRDAMRPGETFQEFVASAKKQGLSTLQEAMEAREVAKGESTAVGALPQAAGSCPECKTDDGLSVRGSRLVCGKCAEQVEDSLGWLNAEFANIIEEANGDVAVLAEIGGIIDDFRAVVEQRDWEIVGALGEAI